LNWYLDSSAILKLVVDESESSAMRNIFNDRCATSVISRIEVIRNIRRIDISALASAQEILGRISTIPLNESALRTAEAITASTNLKSLDCIHIGSMISSPIPLQGIITYDKAMAANAEILGIKVLSPS
jgi:predicted nucleic acid-binding protein